MSVKINPTYKNIIACLEEMNPVEEGGVTKNKIECSDENHLVYAINSYYGFGQLSTSLHFIELGGFIYAVNVGEKSLCFETPIKDNKDGSFTRFVLNTESYSKLESLAI